MAKIKRNFKITNVGGKTHIDMTADIITWCLVNGYELSRFIAWMSIDKDAAAVGAKLTPKLELLIEEKKIILVVVESVEPKTAYAIGDTFISWYLNRIESLITSVKLISEMSKDI